MLLDFIDISSGDGAVYLKLYQQIRKAVLDHVIKNGEKLPSIREAAAQLNISRTSVENAYMKLCMEGIAESKPQKGYYISNHARREKSDKISNTVLQSKEYQYNFSGRKIDPYSADIKTWKKTLRSVLTDDNELLSYGDPQGEPVLRAALCEYAFKARGVRCHPENIIIGAGIGPLLNILCGLTGRNVKIGFENGGFQQASRIFSDYDIPCIDLLYDNNGALPKDLIDENIDILFLMPSKLPKISVSALTARRNEFIGWADKKTSRLIIEDDYNGELRYTARSMTAFQGKYPERTIYIGSFSKLLLPSVRIAYMVLPDSLTEKFMKKRFLYNQTCGKAEQLALTGYINNGLLEKHLRKLRKYYNIKSHILCDAVEEYIKCLKGYTLFESSLEIELQTSYNTDSKTICKVCSDDGIYVLPSEKNGAIRLCFVGIQKDKIADAVKMLNRSFEKLG